MSITFGDWKYINGTGPGGFTNRIMGQFPGILTRDEHPGQLYDLSQDIGERHNLYSKNPKKVKELADMLAIYVKKPTREME